MIFHSKLVHLTLSTLILCTSSSAFADDAGRFYGKLYGGVSTLSDKGFDQTGIAATGATGKGAFSTGMVAGAAAGYYVNNHISTELAWDYRSNDNDDIAFSDGTNFSEGNYASNIFFINGYYHFDSLGNSNFKPYLGAGLGYVEEIDMDLEANGVETSYSKEGELAYQLIAGTSYSLSNNWDITADARYVRFDGVTLENEAGNGSLKDVDYDPLSLTIGASYKF